MESPMLSLPETREVAENLLHDCPLQHVLFPVFQELLGRIQSRLGPACS